MSQKKKVDPLVLAVILVVHTTITALTWRDLSRRAPDRVRGPKGLWRAASGANTLGSAAYWLFGRRSTS